jgi:hypothetical protein
MKKLIGGGVLIFIGLFMLLGVFSGDTLGKGSLASNAVLIFLFIVAPIGVGGLFIRSHFTGKRKALFNQEKAIQEQREKQIIRLAQQKGGRLTIPEIAVDTSMTTTEAEEFMREMTAKGYVDMQVTDAGVIVYEFYEIVHRNSLDE